MANLVAGVLFFVVMQGVYWATKGAQKTHLEDCVAHWGLIPAPKVEGLVVERVKIMVSKRKRVWRKFSRDFRLFAGLAIVLGFVSLLHGIYNTSIAIFVAFTAAGILFSF